MKRKNSFWDLVFLIFVALGVGIVLSGCSDLPPQENYCEIAFAYNVDADLPETLEKKKIGCACAVKDILRGERLSGWVFHPLENCRRIRGFSPKQWKDTIDVFFQTKSQTKAIVKRLKK